MVAYNKADLLAERPPLPPDGLYVSAVTGEGVHELKEKLGSFAKTLENPRKLVADLLSPGDVTVLVIPIDANCWTRTCRSPPARTRSCGRRSVRFRARRSWS